MIISTAFNKIRYLLFVSVMICVWLLLGMVYFEKFPPPFDRLMPLMMPWKYGPNLSRDSMEDRLSFMQGMLHASTWVSDLAFVVMAVSFTVLSVYLTLIYQQKQRRWHENRLLLLKNQEIARRNEFIRYISATIGHEFKNNLGRIKRRIDLLAELPLDVKRRLDDNMGKLFADIDIFKKISDEREAGLKDFSKIDLREMLERLAEQYSDLADITFQGSIPPPAIFASKVLMKTVFENIIDNAIKHKKPEQPRARIVVFSSLDIDTTRTYLSLSFRDEGTGMDEEQMDRCFYKNKTTQEGWGEGLYFAKYVVGLHAGKIRVGKEHTATGKGAEIIINLPFVEETLHV